MTFAARLLAAIVLLFAGNVASAGSVDAGRFARWQGAHVERGGLRGWQRHWRRDRFQRGPRNPDHAGSPDRPKPSKTPDKPDRPDVVVRKHKPHHGPQRADTPAPECAAGQTWKRGRCRPSLGVRPLRAVPAVAPAPRAAPGKSQDASDERARPPARTATAERATAPDRVADEILITIDQASPETVEETLAARHGVRIVERTALPLIGARLIRLRLLPGRPVAALAAEISSSGQVLQAQPNYVYRPSAATRAGKTAPPAMLQYAMTWLHAPQAHERATGRGVAIAVLDSGVDLQHPDLAGASIEAFDATAVPGTQTAEQADERADAHGTEVAGLIIARGSLQGIAPAARILSARVVRPAALEGDGTATSATLVKGLSWSVEHGARIINVSLAGPRDGLLQRALSAAQERGAIIVAAAGNGGKSAPAAYPAAYPDVLAVTAVDERGGLYSEANRGTYIALAAPGVDIVVPSAGGAHDYRSGTSYAAAYVSGMLALVAEVRRNLTAEMARDLISQTARDLGAPGLDPEFGYGAPDAAAMVNAAGKAPALAQGQEQR